MYNLPVPHTPVLLREALEILNLKTGEVVLDATLGLGGHAEAFLGRVGHKGKLIGLDADKKNLEEAKRKLSQKNVVLLHANFRDIHSLKLPPLDVLFADLGLSSPHIDDPERGFTFREDSPLDLRFDQTNGETASDLLMRSTTEDLTTLFREYGEIDRARHLAEVITEKRKKHPLLRSSDLLTIMDEVFHFKAKKALPQVFQALRIAVNDEIGALASLLEHGPMLLKPNGRMGIISYHSLEDRMVKNRFRELSAGDSTSSFRLLAQKPILPTMEEIQANPRARSAKFRIIQRV